MDSLIMGVIQMDSQAVKQDNLKKAEKLIEKAVALGANFVALPENVNYIGAKEGKLASAEKIPGETSEFFAGLARKHNIWVNCGSFAEETANPQMVYNTSLVFDSKGNIVAKYRKIHLYDVDISNGPSVKESAVVIPGTEIVSFDNPFGKMGLSICYDMRFPELYRIMALQGAKLMFVPANYTLFTGKDHWEAVLRTRAIENQCFIVAAGQCGVKPAFQAYGRSLIIDPWGTIIATASDGEGVTVAEIDMGKVEKIRKQLPSLPNRRPETYKW